MKEQTEKQQIRVDIIAEINNRLYCAYRMKEMFRLLLKIKLEIEYALVYDISLFYQEIQHLLGMGKKQVFCTAL